MLSLLSLCPTEQPVFCMFCRTQHLGSFCALFQKLGRNSKKAHCRAKQIQILGLGVCMYLACILVIFTLNMSRSFGVLWCTFQIRRAVTQTAHHRTKRTKIWALGVYVVCVLVFLTLNMSRSFGVFGALFQKLGFKSKTGHRRAKVKKIWASVE